MKIKKSKLKRKKNVNNSKKKRLNRNKKKSLYTKRGGTNNNQFKEAQEDDKGICENVKKGQWIEGECFFEAIEQFDFFKNKKEVDKAEMTRIDNKIKEYSKVVPNPEDNMSGEKEKIITAIKEKMKEVFVFDKDKNKIIGIKKNFIKSKDSETFDILEYIYGNNDSESTTNNQTNQESNVIIPTDDDNYVKIMDYLMTEAKTLDTKLKEDKVSVLEEEKNQQTAGGDNILKSVNVPKVTKAKKFTAAIGYTLSVALGPITVIGIGVFAAYKYSKYKKYGRHPIIITCKDTHKLFNDIQNIETICRQKAESEEGLSDEEREKYLENIKEIMIKISLNKNTLQESLTKLKTTGNSSGKDENPATALIDILNVECKKSSGGGVSGGNSNTLLIGLGKAVLPVMNEILYGYHTGIQENCRNPNGFAQVTAV